MSRIHACDKPGVLSAARKMMEEVGYDSFNMRTLAGHCGLAVGTLYNYFPSKYHIVQEIMIHDWTAMLVELDTLIAGSQEPKVKLRAMYRLIRDMFTRTHHFWAKGYASIYSEIDMSGVRLHQEEFRAELAGRLLKIVPSSPPGEDGESLRRLSRLSDGIVRLMFSYSADRADDEDAVVEVISVVYDSMIGGERQ